MCLVWAMGEAPSWVGSATCQDVCCQKTTCQGRGEVVAHRSSATAPWTGLSPGVQRGMRVCIRHKQL